MWKLLQSTNNNINRWLSIDFLITYPLYIRDDSYSKIIDNLNETKQKFIDIDNLTATQFFFLKIKINVYNSWVLFVLFCLFVCLFVPCRYFPFCWEFCLMEFLLGLHHWELDRTSTQSCRSIRVSKPSPRD